MSRKLRCWIEGYLHYTENSEPSVAYRKWMAISTLAAVLKRKTWLEWGAETFYPNLYVVLVGPPAARKGTAMKQAKGFMDRLGIDISADESSWPALIRSLIDVQNNSLAVARPGLPPISHTSLTVFSTELTVFLGYEDKDLLSKLCKLYDCEARFVYDTVSRGKEEVSNVFVNLVGATTPSQLQASVPEGFIGSGFTSRVIFVYAADKGKVVIKPELSAEARSLREDLLLDLHKIHAMVGEFKPTQAFEKLYTEWRISSEQEKLFKDPRLDYYAQRRPTHLFKLSTIYSASRRDNMVVEQEDLVSAIDTLHEAELKMPLVFQGLGSNPMAGVTARLRQLLQERGALPLSEVAEIFSHDATFTQLGEVISSLEQMNVCATDVANRRLVYLGRRRKENVGE